MHENPLNPPRWKDLDEEVVKMMQEGRLEPTPAPRKRAGPPISQRQAKDIQFFEIAERIKEPPPPARQPDPLPQVPHPQPRYGPQFFEGLAVGFLALGWIVAIFLGIWIQWLLSWYYVIPRP